MGDSPNSFLAGFGLPPINPFQTGQGPEVFRPCMPAPLDLFPASKPMNDPYQSHFEYGKDHFSTTHDIHSFGSTAPVQRDLGLRMPDDSYKKLCATDSPDSVYPWQTKLTDFKF